MTPPRMPVRLVLFDVDDTLCDYASARALRLRHAFELAFRVASAPLPADMNALIAESIAIHAHGADHFADLLARHGAAHVGAAAEARRWYQTNRFHGLSLFPDALQTLALARGSDHPRQIGLITNGPADIQRDKVELLELMPHVDFVLISGEFGIAKPDPAIFHAALERAGIGPSDAVYIGDSPEFDVAGAHASGITAIWVNRTGHPWAGAGQQPDHVITELGALPPLLDGRD